MDFSRLASLREDNDLTQKSLGNILNCGKYSISKWEKGREIIPLTRLNDYANYFNVSMDYLLKLSNNKKSNGKKELDKVLIGNRLKELRLENKLSQRALAKILNTTHSTIYSYEKGKNLILTSFAYQICKTFNVSMDYLCGRKEHDKVLVKN